MEEIKEDSKTFDKIKVFYSEDDKLKIFGELLSNKSSRDIIKFLIEKERYTNEIAKKLEIRPNLVIHHLKKMEELGLLEITEKKISKNGNKHKFYKMIPNVFISPNYSKQEFEKKVMFKKIFKQGLKFATIGLVASAVWMADVVKLTNTKEIYPVPFGTQTQQLDPLIPALIIIIIGLVLERIFSLKKKKKRG